MKLLSLEENAQFLRCTPKALRNKVTRKQIPYKKLAGRIVFLEAEILEWIENAPGVSLSDLKRD